MSLVQCGVSIEHANTSIAITDHLHREMSDEYGPVIAEELYKHMFEHEGRQFDGDFQLDITKSSPALHYAMKKLRDEGVPFVRCSRGVESKDD